MNIQYLGEKNQIRRKKKDKKKAFDTMKDDYQLHLFRIILKSFAVQII